MHGLKLLTFIFFSGFAATLRADPTAPPYIPMTLCEPKPYASVRDYWDYTGKFCFEANNHRYLYPITGLKEVRLRNNGKWLSGPYVDSLTEDNRAIVGEYDLYGIRYLALGPKNGTNQPFVAQVFYKWTVVTLTTYVFGELDDQGVPHLTGFSDAHGNLSNLRSTLSTVRNILSLNWKSPNRDGVNEQKAKERRRILPSRDVIQKFQKDGNPPAPTPTP